jgi:adenylate cyclase
MRSFLSELKRRRVFRAAAVYAIAGWVVVEVAATTFPLLGLPAWAPTLVLALTLLGVPLALVLAWALELTPDGIRRTESLRGPTAPAAATQFGPLPGYVLLGGTVLLLGLFTYAQVRPRGGSPPAPGELRIGSIAVLPFLDLSPAGDQAHLGVGMAEELLDALAKVPGLNVTARTSSFQFRDRDVDIREVGRQLNVDAVIEGSIRKQGDRLRITAQLVKTSDGYQLWSSRYDRQLQDVFALQDEISRSILLSIRPRLVAATAVRAGHPPTSDLAAYEEFLKASHALGTSFATADLDQVVKGLERALALDPHFALAHAALSEAHQAMALLAPPGPFLGLAERSALRALELEPQLPEAIAALANLKHVRFEWDAATELYRRSIQLNPTLAAACKCYGFHLMTLGEMDAAIEELERARALDPVSVSSYYLLATAYYNAGRFADVSAQVEHAYRLNREDPSIDLVAAWMDWADGNYDAALQRLTRGTAPGDLDLRTLHPYTIAQIAYTLGRAGRHTEARQLLRRFEQIAAKSYVSPVWFAAIHAGLGETAQALQHLDRGYREHAVEISLLLSNPMSEPLRALPAYHDFLRRIGLGRRLDAEG